ncbi:DEAD/DEAH box helicase [Brevundimonas sp.]|uniref:DEAD/DEAH box helicase n=1 Tax=Brevundimonas sp. TaxID=1871086 RepID=UPI0028A294A5|nr:DEAD/DEAH box helicase [Brevundimonas sp.]
MMNFFRRKVASETAGFEYEIEGERLRLMLKSKGRMVPVSDWCGLRADAASAVSEIMTLTETQLDRSVQIDDQSITLSPAALAKLNAAAATVLALPSPTPLALDLKPQGRIDQDDFRLDTRWVRPGGQPCRVQVHGALIDFEGQTRRIPEPLWSILQIAKELGTPRDKTERFRLLSLLRRHWPDDNSGSVSSDPYIRDMRIHYASTLSLTLRTLTPDRTDFDPVLFGQGATEEAADQGRPLDEALDNVLTPSAQKLFAEDRFRREADVRPVYLLRDGEYIFIDPALRPALNAVRRLQDRPEAERRAFVLNPRKVLKETLGEKLSDEIALDELFVETEQFSSRVAGVDVWRTSVLPWIVPSGKNNWLPERFGLRVGDDYYEVPAESVSAILEQVTKAASEGRPTASVEGLLKPATADADTPPKILPVNEQVLEALESLRPFASANVAPREAEAPENSPPLPDDWNAALQGKLFLVVRENFEEVEFAPFQADDATPPLSPLRIPERLSSTLKPHQVEGVSWLVRSVETLHPGGLLADDMGLGKTLQAIAFMAWLQEEADAGRRPHEPFLIVAPTGLLGTWKSEINKHLSGKKLGVLLPAFGSDLKLLREEDSLGQRDIETGRAALKSENWRDVGVVLTTYETLRDYHFSFARTRFGLIVYDEIQKLKNPVSQMTRAAKTLNASFTLGMTGTPIENRLQDLWSIMDVIAPGFLGASRDFEKRHPADDRAALARLKTQLTEAPDGHAPYMLRRLKADALTGMPQKLVHPFETDMPPAQASAYKDIVVRAAAANAGGMVGKGSMLTTLAGLRGVSLHPLDPRHAPADLEAYARDSARLWRTLDILKDIFSRSEKALIFVEDLAMQDRLAGLIQTRFALSRPPMRIHGGVPGPKRQEMVEAFQSRPGVFDVMILSPKAGGVGLTLTEANHVIHLSRWWNPAVEDQATDRVFRIGQTRDVHVHLPMAVHPDPAIRESSFDLRLNDLIDRKRQLTRDLFLPPEGNDGELADLFREVSLGDKSAEPPPVISEDADAPSSSPTAETPTATASTTSTAPVRETLRLPRALANTGIRQWRVAAHGERPTKDIIALFAGKDLVDVTIRDPYALGGRSARNAQVRFLTELKAAARSVEAITIEYAEEIVGDVTDSEARRDIGDQLSRQLKPVPRLSLKRRRKRTHDDDFHDRFIDISIRHAGGAIRVHELSLGRGIEALYDERKQCTVTYAPPSLAQ